MSGINVLSDSLKDGSGFDKISNLKGKNATDSLDNAAAEFAAMLSGLTNMSADPIGQNSNVGGDLEVGRDPDSLVHNLGYGHFMLSCLSQPMALGDLPAGKEANSGNGVNQGPEESLSANSNLSMVALSKLFLDSNGVFGIKGMTSQVPQGNNPGTSELDKYRQVIADLLVALSGQITDSSEGVALASERGASERQEMMKLVQGWLAVTDNVDKADKTLIIDGQSANRNTVGNIEGVTPLHRGGFETLDDEARSKVLNILGTSNGVITDLSSQEASLVLDRDMLKTIQSANTQIIEDKSVQFNSTGLETVEDVGDLRRVIARTVQDWIQGSGNSAEGEPNLSLQKVIKPLIDFLTNQQRTGSQALGPQASSLLMVLNQIISQVQETNLPQGDNNEILQANSDKLEAIFNQAKTSKETSLHTDLKQEFAEIDLLHSNPLKNLQGVSNEEGLIGEQAESSELSGVKTSQNLGLGIGLDGKIVTGNVADGKTVAIPVWEQISNVFREKISSRNQELKELDIQLHPADLGRIRIGLRWENGQVHLQVHASEAATGQIIQNQLSELRNTLTNQGVNCGELQMGQQGRDQQQNQNHQGDQFSTNHSYTNQIEDEEQFSVVNSPSHGELNSRINVTA